MPPDFIGSGPGWPTILFLWAPPAGPTIVRFQSGGPHLLSPLSSRLPFPTSSSLLCILKPDLWFSARLHNCLLCANCQHWHLLFQMLGEHACPSSALTGPGLDMRHAWRCMLPPTDFSASPSQAFPRCRRAGWLEQANPALPVNCNNSPPVHYFVTALSYAPHS